MSEKITVLVLAAFTSVDFGYALHITATEGLENAVFIFGATLFMAISTLLVGIRQILRQLKDE